VLYNFAEFNNKDMFLRNIVLLIVQLVYVAIYKFVQFNNNDMFLKKYRITNFVVILM
jgi:hypothetical protein